MSKCIIGLAPGAQVDFIILFIKILLSLFQMISLNDKFVMTERKILWFV